jgi:predicted DCC family thiol-disulfide oxidoreductase YuxK
MTRVFYDMQCGFCSRMISRLRKNKNLKTVDFQDYSRLNLFLSIDQISEIQGVDSIVVIDKMEVAVYSDAIIKLLRIAGSVYKPVTYCMLLIPRSARDNIYRFIARHRYVFFGKRIC